jgi:cell shape-determining protein MreC
MNKLSFLLIIFLGLSLCSCDQKSSKEARQDVTEVSKELKSKKEKWVAIINEEIAKVEKDLENLTTAGELESQLKESKKRLEQNLTRVKAASADDWSDIKNEVQGAIGDVEKALEGIEKELDKLSKDLDDTFDND